MRVYQAEYSKGNQAQSWHLCALLMMGKPWLGWQKGAPQNWFSQMQRGILNGQTISLWKFKNAWKKPPTNHPTANKIPNWVKKWHFMCLKICSLLFLGRIFARAIKKKKGGILRKIQIKKNWLCSLKAFRSFVSHWRSTLGWDFCSLNPVELCKHREKKECKYINFERFYSQICTPVRCVLPFLQFSHWKGGAEMGFSGIFRCLVTVLGIDGAEQLKSCVLQVFCNSTIKNFTKSLLLYWGSLLAAKPGGNLPQEISP